MASERLTTGLPCSIAVGVGLERASRAHTDVIGLLLRENRHLSAQGRQVQSRHLLIQGLGQQVHVVLVRLGGLPVVQQVKLTEHLVREGARHHEGRVARGAAQVHQAPGSQNNHAVAIREHEAVHLRLDVLHLDARKALNAGHVDLVVEVTDVTDDGVVLHLLHVRKRDDVEVARGRGEDVDLTHNGLHRHHLEALHAGLQRADRVDLGDEHAGTRTAQREGAALAHIAVAAHERALAANHHVRGAHDAVRQGVAAAVDVVELRLRHAVVHVDRREEQLTLGGHLPKREHARRGLLAHALADLGHARVLGLVERDGVLQQLQDALELGVRGAVRVRQGAVLGKLLLKLLALVDQESGIAAVIHELVAAVRTRHRHHLLSAPPVLRQRLALPGEDRAGALLRDGRGGVVLRAEDVARAPAHLGAQRLQGLNQHGRLNRHVQRAVDVQALQGLRGAVLRAGSHETRHLVLGEVQLLAAELGQAHVLHLGVSHCSSGGVETGGLIRGGRTSLA
mmetsp:Transcript_14139/g.37449  ORF Transcript_14139/g.37449 Transcript_14139/m.37449 type:complete len:510 (+) Transcript_14139:196-1725(+)